MPISFKCACGQGLKVKDELAGRAVKCPKCAKVAKVPAPEPAPAPAADDGIRLVEESPAPPEPEVPAPSRLRGRPSMAERLASRRQSRGGDDEKAALLKGLAGGLAGAIVGALVWFLVAKGLTAKIGWVAWGIGLAAGFGVLLFSGGRGGALLPVAGAATALAGWFIGEYMIYAWLFPDLVMAEMMKQAGKAASKEEAMMAKEFAKALVQVVPFTTYLKNTFGAMDILFVLLAVGTGWGVPAKAQNA